MSVLIVPGVSGVWGVWGVSEAGRGRERQRERRRGERTLGSMAGAGVPEHILTPVREREREREREELVPPYISHRVSTPGHPAPGVLRDTS